MKINSLALLNDESGQIHELNHRKAEVAAFSTKSPEKGEENNEDSALIVHFNTTYSVMAVADGLGGHRGGAQASKLALETLQDKLKSINSGDNGFDEQSLREIILSTLESAHKKIQDLGLGAGTTIVVAEIFKKQVRFYNAGDSVGLIVGGQGTLKYKTVEHSLVGLGVEVGLIKEDQAMQHHQRNVILNALGLNDLRIEISPWFPLSKRDCVLLASDGLTDNATIQEITERISKDEAKVRVDKLKNLAHSRMHPESKDDFGHADDLSIVIYRCQE